MSKIITIGEIMLRLSTNNYERLVQANKYKVNFGGSEANVGVSLSIFGHDSYFVSKLPDNDLGQSAIISLREYGVKTKYIARGGDRIGIYFLEPGSSMRSSKVIYDRKNSSFSTINLNELDFMEIFKDATWFHFSGITPALSKNTLSVLEEAIMSAKKNNIMISCDINYRKKLWSYEESSNVMANLLKNVDVCIGYGVNDFIISSDNIADETYIDIIKKFYDNYNFKYLALTIRENISASFNKLSGIIYDGNTIQLSKKYDINIVDRVGTGDSFAAGLIYGLITKNDPKYALEFGVAASSIKHTIPGDFNIATVEEIEALIKGDTSGKVQR